MPKLTTEQRRGMIEILMNPDDPRDVAACIDYYKDKRVDIKLAPDDLPPRDPEAEAITRRDSSLKREIPDRKELINKILEISYEVRNEISADLEQGKLRERGYSQTLSARAGAIADARIEQLLQHNVAIENARSVAYTARKMMTPEGGSPDSVAATIETPVVPAQNNKPVRKHMQR